MAYMANPPGSNKAPPVHAHLLSDLTDFDITSPSNGEILIFNGGTNKWENENFSGSHTHDDRYYTEAEVDALTWDTSDIVSGTFANGRISEGSVTQHEGAIDHDALNNFVAGEHFTEASITHNNIGGLTTGDPHTQYMLDAGTVTDNSVPRFDGTDGRTTQSSGLVITDAGQLEWTATADYGGAYITGSGASNGPAIIFYHNIADCDDKNISAVYFKAKHDGGGVINYARYYTYVSNNTEGAEASTFSFTVMSAGVFTTSLVISGGDQTINIPTGWTYDINGSPHTHDDRYYTEAEVDALTWDTSDIVSGTFANARISEGSVTQHEGAIDHDALNNFAVGKHRTINDSGSGATDLWSASKIVAQLALQHTIDPDGYWNFIHLNFNDIRDGGGVSPAQVVEPTASTLGGWEMSDDTERILIQFPIPADWNADTDILLDAYIVDDIGVVGAGELNVNLCTYMGNGDVALKAQAIASQGFSSTGTQYELMKVTFILDHDFVSNVIDAEDIVTMIFSITEGAFAVTGVTFPAFTVRYKSDDPALGV